MIQPFLCGVTSSPFPLGQGPLLYFDDKGQDVSLPAFAFGGEAQRRAIDWTGPDFGALSLELGTRTGIFSPPFLQSYVTALAGSPGLYSVSLPGVQLPSMVLFLDGFESGDFVAWSSKVP